VEYFVLIRGYIDESYDGQQNIFAMSCVLAQGKHWLEIERQWKLQLRAKNKELKRAGRPTISRYHAAACHSRKAEFEGWSQEERNAFVLKLFGVLKRMRGGTHTVGYDVSLDDLCEVFPEWATDRLGAGYNFLTRFIIYAIGDDHHKLAPGAEAKITLFHDRTSGYDGLILNAFNRFILDDNFEHAHYFTTIAPLSWQHCIALQPADLVAFEIFKDAERRKKAREQRKAFRALLDMPSFGVHTVTLTKETMQAIRQQWEANKLVK
jgi:hypothetical protein